MTQAPTRKSHVRSAMTMLAIRVDYNHLESAFLLSSSMVLVLGMVFASQGFPQGSMSYNALVVLTAALVVGSAGAFIVLLVFEVFRSVKFAAIHNLARLAEEDAVEAALLERFSRRRSTTPSGSSVDYVSPRRSSNLSQGSLRTTGSQVARRRSSIAERFKFQVATPSSLSMPSTLYGEGTEGVGDSEARGGLGTFDMIPGHGASSVRGTASGEPRGHGDVNSSPGREGHAGEQALAFSSESVVWVRSAGLASPRVAAQAQSMAGRSQGSASGTSGGRGPPSPRNVASLSGVSDARSARVMSMTRISFVTVKAEK